MGSNGKPEKRIFSVEACFGSSRALKRISVEARCAFLVLCWEGSMRGWEACGKAAETAAGLVHPGPRGQKVQ